MTGQPLSGRPISRVEADHRSSRRRGIAGIVLPVLVLLIGLVLVWPQALGMHRLLGVAQIVSFRALLGLGLVALALGSGLLTLLRPRGRRVLAGGLTMALFVSAMGQGGVLLSRGWEAPPVEAGSLASASAGDLTVLTWNTHGGDASPQEVARLVLASRADVVALPETDAATAEEIAAILEQDGHPMIPDTTGANVPTSVLIAEGLGPYRLDPDAGTTPRLPSGVWVPADPGSSSPPLVIAHPMRPSPGHMEEWRDGLDWLATQCRTLGPDVVIAGDLNATPDHLGDLGGCRDAAQGAGSAAWGTWPSTSPSGFATPIDHVLTGPGWSPMTSQVIDVGPGSSDHRPLVAVLART